MGVHWWGAIARESVPQNEVRRPRAAIWASSTVDGVDKASLVTPSVGVLRRVPGQARILPCLPQPPLDRRDLRYSVYLDFLYQNRRINTHRSRRARGSVERVGRNAAARMRDELLGVAPNGLDERRLSCNPRVEFGCRCCGCLRARCRHVRQAHRREQTPPVCGDKVRKEERRGPPTAFILRCPDEARICWSRRASIVSRRATQGQHTPCGPRRAQHLEKVHCLCSSVPPAVYYLNFTQVHTLYSAKRRQLSRLRTPTPEAALITKT
jgi:hypothetical protein